MQTRFKFTNTNLKAVAANDMSSRSTELELSDSELSGLKLLVGKSGNKRFLFRIVTNPRNVQLPSENPLILTQQQLVKLLGNIRACWQMTPIQKRRMKITNQCQP